MKNLSSGTALAAFFLAVFSAVPVQAATTVQSATTVQCVVNSKITNTQRTFKTKHMLGARSVATLTTTYIKAAGNTETRKGAGEAVDLKNCETWTNTYKKYPKLYTVLPTNINSTVQQSTSTATGNLCQNVCSTKPRSHFCTFYGAQQFTCGLYIDYNNTNFGNIGF